MTAVHHDNNTQCVEDDYICFSFSLTLSIPSLFSFFLCSSLFVHIPVLSSFSPLIPVLLFSPFLKISLFKLTLFPPSFVFPLVYFPINLSFFKQLFCHYSFQLHHLLND